MQSIKILTLQVISLLVLIGSAEDFMERITATLFFILSFMIFASCSIYISRHEKELLRDIRRING